MTRVSLLTLLLVVAAAAQEPKFEIADVHLSPTAKGFAQNFGGVLREGRYVNRDATLLNLIAAAYGVSEDSVAGGPGWLSSDLFDIVAKAPAGTTMANANLMLRELLSDRFQLIVHQGTQPVPRYVLTIGKGGSKLKAGSGAGSPGCQQVQGANPADPMPRLKVACHDLTPAMIADNLHQMANGYFDHDVIDQTKLEGTWDFELEWTPRGALGTSGSVSVFEAVEKQLGLKADLQNVPLPSLAVEKVNRKPAANPAAVATALVIPAARFEAATIKLADPNARPFVGLLYTGGSQMRAGGTLRQMIAMALQVSPNVAADLVVGLPKSADSQRWDITAKVPSTGEGAPNIVGGRPLPPPLSVGLEMLRGLLLDQFELKTHIESREVTAYVLTMGNGKPKMIRAEETERTSCKPDPSAPKPASGINTMIACKNTEMAELAVNLQQMANAYIDHPVVDGTGLAGGWDFVMGWTPRAAMQNAQTSAPDQPDGGLPVASDPNGITVFEAMEKELGLKLVKQKRAVPVIVIDHVDEKPIQ